MTRPLPSTDPRLNSDGTLNVERPVPYKQQLSEMHAGQSGMSRAEVADELATTSEYAEDLDALVEAGRQRKHNWIDRGLKMSCEGAGHPWHEVWKPMQQK